MTAFNTLQMLCPEYDAVTLESQAFRCFQLSTVCGCRLQNMAAYEPRHSFRSVFRLLSLRKICCDTYRRCVYAGPRTRQLVRPRFEARPWQVPHWARISQREHFKANIANAVPLCSFWLFCLFKPTFFVCWQGLICWASKDWGSLSRSIGW